MKRVLLAALLALPMTLGAQMQGTELHKGTGVVTSIDRAGGKVTLKHDPIKSLNWPAMTMAFGVKDKAMLDKLAKDKKVEFEFVQQGQQFVITSIK
jgi:Cu(I)/Ag(I) efflux system protein CusF